MILDLFMLRCKSCANTVASCDVRDVRDFEQSVSRHSVKPFSLSVFTTSNDTKRTAHVMFKRIFVCIYGYQMVRGIIYDLWASTLGVF